MDKEHSSSLIATWALSCTLSCILLSGLAVTARTGVSGFYFHSADWPGDQSCLLPICPRKSDERIAVASDKCRSILNSRMVRSGSTVLPTGHLGLGTDTSGFQTVLNSRSGCAWVNGHYEGHLHKCWALSLPRDLCPEKVEPIYSVTSALSVHLENPIPWALLRLSRALGLYYPIKDQTLFY